MSLNVQSLPPIAMPRRNSMSSFSQILTSGSPFRDRTGSNRLTDKPRPRSGSKILERPRAHGSADPTEDTIIDEGLSALLLPLKITCVSSEIIKALKHPAQGLSYFNIPHNLPNYTFVTADAVHWLINHMDGVTSIERAVQVMQNLHKERLIRHASGDPNKQFLYGFFLFYILPEKPEKDSFQPSGDLASFENDFIEVEIKPALNWGYPTNQTSVRSGSSSNIPITGAEQETGVPHFLCDDIDPEYGEVDLDGIMYKKVRLETDVTGKSDRVEWGHARYQAIFRPDQAYEIVAEWLTSSGSIVGELLFGWHRKGQTCNLQMIPIPHDPLALPYSDKSDPLRGPIFIPLNISCLEAFDNPFKAFPEETWQERMFLFQEAIIQRFGFINCLTEPTTTNENQSREHQYIHATGTIFILISNKAPRSERSRANSMKGNRQLLDKTKYNLHMGSVPSPHEAYITRHVSGQNKDDYDNSKKMGFLWCWNHMISKKWRTNQGVDSNFQIKCLKDFKAFCNNSEGRLKDFWRDSWDAKAMANLNK